RPLGQHPALGATLRERNVTTSYLYQVLGSFGTPPSEDAVIDRLLRQSRRPADVERLRVPVLMLGGEHDELFPPALLRACGSLLPDVDVRVLAGVGHSGYFEDPEAWNREVGEFLASVSARTTGPSDRGNSA
ncbi:MAG: alpha/beta hydrolase, partial [Pseudonocardia sp.]|nr:alpha/beta hydrolase [Pseudonocardia sp.]